MNKKHTTKKCDICGRTDKVTTRTFKRGEVVEKIKVCRICREKSKK